MDAGVVVKAAVAILRLCRRLLPYKPEFAEPLLRGLQLVPGLAPEMAWENAQVIGHIKFCFFLALCRRWVILHCACLVLLLLVPPTNACVFCHTML